MNVVTPGPVKRLNKTLYKYFPNSDHKLITFSRSWGQRSRSQSDGHGNLVNSLAPEPYECKTDINTSHTRATN